MFKLFAVAAGAALLAFAHGIANAQDDTDGMLCVYDAVSAESYEAVAEAFLYGEGEAIKSVDVLLDRATQTCSDSFKYSEGEAAAARELAIYAVSVDYLTDDLMFMGVPDDAVDGVFDIFAALDADDIDLLYETGWRDNADFVARLKVELLKAGFPDMADELHVAYDILEISALADDAMFVFSFSGDE